MEKSYWLKNVTLEVGFDEIDNNYFTRTDSFNILVKDGRFAEITDVLNNTENLPVYDAEHNLMLPSYVEKHAHVDKTYEGELRWRAFTAEDSILGIVKSETKLYPTFKTSISHRAKKLFDQYIMHGSTRLRTHVDTVKDVKLNHLEEVLKAADDYKDKLYCETVAFPQHGLLLSDSFDRLDYALKNGADLLGGLDPFTIDKDRSKSLNLTFELATKHNVDIDYHLHERGEIGFESFLKLMELTKEAKWQNRVSISHGFFLKSVPEAQKEYVCELLKENGVELITTVPINGSISDFKYFTDRGVSLAMGCDGIHDSWDPCGMPNVLERLSNYCVINEINREKDLAYSLRHVTGNITPVGLNGERVWPMVNDKANFLIVPATCSAETVGRRRPNKAVVFGGNLVYGEL